MAEATAQEAALQLAGNAVPHSGDPLARAQMLPLRLVLETPIINFTVRMLMELQPGTIVETAAQHNEDLLLHVNGQLVGSVKFDVTRDKLAVRLTGVV
jgi:flagellar motor switch/type III secretory pathway protein FliN